MQHLAGVPFLPCFALRREVILNLLGLKTSFLDSLPRWIAEFHQASQT